MVGVTNSGPIYFLHIERRCLSCHFIILTFFESTENDYFYGQNVNEDRFPGHKLVQYDVAHGTAYSNFDLIADANVKELTNLHEYKYVARGYINFYKVFSSCKYNCAYTTTHHILFLIYKMLFYFSYFLFRYFVAKEYYSQTRFLHGVTIVNYHNIQCPETNFYYHVLSHTNNV